MLARLGRSLQAPRFFLNQAFPACEREDDEDVGCWKSELPEHRLRNSMGRWGDQIFEQFSFGNLKGKDWTNGNVMEYPIGLENGATQHQFIGHPFLGKPLGNPMGF